MKKISLLFAVLLFLSACTSIQVKNNEHLVTLDVGMSLAEVTELMGTPQLSEMYVSEDGQSVSVLYYRTQKNLPASTTVKNSCTPVVFVDDRLTGWGNHALINTANRLRLK